MRRILVIILTSCAFGSCNSPSIKGKLDTYEQDLERKPKEIYELLTEVQKDKQRLSAEDEARLAILTLRAKDLDYIPLEGKDSVSLKKAIEYYSWKHNRQMLMQGYYLLGGVYRDVGDAPRGVETYMKVIEAADTTSKDCDYKLMARAMAQKADLQERQNVLPKAVESKQQAAYYALKGKDTAYYFYSAFGIIAQQALRGDFVPLRENSTSLIQQCMAYGDTLLAVYRTVGFAWFFLQQGMVQEADSMLSLYDRYDGRPYPIYYGTKGENHLAHGRLDSAEYCFRKELEAADWNNRQSAYRGLKKVFAQRHQLDSALKYATLQCDAVDSDYQHKVSETIVQMEQVYNYEAEKEQATKARLEQARMKMQVAYLLLGLGLLGALVVLLWQRNWTRLRHEQAEQEQQVKQLKAQVAQLMDDRNGAETKVARLEQSLEKTQTEMGLQQNNQEKILQELETERGRKVEAQAEQRKSQQRIEMLEENKRKGEALLKELRTQISHKERELAQERKRVAEMNAELGGFREEARQMANLSDGVKAMRERIEQGKAATTRDWEALRKEVRRLYPKFLWALQKEAAGVNTTELHVAMLFKMGFKASEIAVLTGLSSSAPNMTKTRLYKKVCGHEPVDAEAAAKWLAELGGDLL